MLSDLVNLRVAPRPIRAVFLTRTMDDFVQAVRLYTHVWGGQLDVILPAPQNDDDLACFDRALDRLNPDILIVPSTSLTDLESRSISKRAIDVLPVNEETINKHVSMRELIRLHRGRMPHPLYILSEMFPQSLPSSRIRLVRNDRDDHVLGTIFGLPSGDYKSYLMTRLGSLEYPLPGTPEEWLRTIVLGTTFMTGLSASRLDISQQPVWQLSDDHSLSDLEDLRMSSNESLTIFLHRAPDFLVPCAFWNARARSPTGNKLLLPWSLLENEDVIRNLFVAAQPEEIVFISSCSKYEAEEFLSARDRQVIAAYRRIPMAFIFAGFEYSITRGSTQHGVARSLLASTGKDHRVGFPLEIPIGHDRPAFVFGYDCKVSSGTGTKLQLPVTRSCARVLSNSIDRLSKARENVREMGELWLRQDRAVRPSSDGITGIAGPGEEVEFFLNDDEVWIRETLANMGIELTPVRSARYALGFVRRFGGMDQALDLIRDGGQHILTALTHHRSIQWGLSREQIIAFLCKELKYERAAASGLVMTRLQQLLAAELVSRGVALKCNECDLGFWKPINELSEYILCPGCRANFQISKNGLGFTFVGNELAKRFLLAGGEAVLQTASTLRMIEPSAPIQFGGELRRRGQKDPFGEIDLFALTRSGLLMAECKAYASVGETELQQIECDGKKLIAIASETGVREAILGIAAREGLDELRRVASSVKVYADECGISLDLIMNGRMHVGCGEEVEIHKVHFAPIYRIKYPHQQHVGAVAQSITMTGQECFSAEIAAGWDRALTGPQ